MATHNQATEHLRDDTQSVACLRERQEGKKKIHGGVQVAIQPDDYNNEDIAGQRNEIQREEQGKKKTLHLPKAGESYKDKATPARYILLYHAE